MKRFALAIFICFAFTATITAQTRDSVYSENKVNGIWQKTELDIITRNDLCSILSVLQLNWNESSQSWMKSFLSKSDSINAIPHSLTQSWDAVNSTWINYSQTFLFGSKNGSERTFQYQTWDAASGSWVNNYRLVDNLDNEGRSITSEYDMYSNNEWQKIQRSLLTYNANNYVSESIFQMWMNNAWTNNGKTTYDYTNGLMFDYLWDIGNKRWTKFRRTFNDYIDNTTLITKAYGQINAGSTWQNNDRYENTYNNNNQTLSNFQQFWDDNMQAWVNASRINMDYYADGNQDHFVFEGWNATTNSWSYGYRSTSTDVSCNESLQLVPVTQLKNNTGAVVQNGKIHFLHRMQGTQPNKNNNITRIFNPLASDRNTLVYDFSFNGDQSHSAAFELILSSVEKPKKISSQTNNNIITSNNAGFMLSPNPAKNYFNINLSAYKDAGNIILTLSDISGKIILQQKMNAGMQRINFPSLQKGVYIVTIISGKSVQNQKLVIE